MCTSAKAGRRKDQQQQQQQQQQQLVEGSKDLFSRPGSVLQASLSETVPIRIPSKKGAPCKDVLVLMHTVTSKVGSLGQGLS